MGAMISAKELHINSPEEEEINQLLPLLFLKQELLYKFNMKYKEEDLFGFLEDEVKAVNPVIKNSSQNQDFSSSVKESLTSQNFKEARKKLLGSQDDCIKQHFYEVFITYRFFDSFRAVL